MSPALRISLFGATGRLGEAVARALARWQDEQPGRLEIVAISAAHNVDRLVAMTELLRPRHAVIADPTAFRHLRDRLQHTGAIPGAGSTACREAAGAAADWLITTVPGLAGLDDVAAACQPGRQIFLADTSAWALGGALLTGLAKRHGCAIRPLHPLLTPLSLAIKPDFPRAQLLILRSAADVLDQASLLFAAATVCRAALDAVTFAHWPGLAEAALGVPAGRMPTGQPCYRAVHAWPDAELAAWLTSGTPHHAALEHIVAGPLAINDSLCARFLTNRLAGAHASRIAILAGLDMVTAMQPAMAQRERLRTVQTLADQFAAGPAIDDLESLVMHDFEARAAAHQLLRSLT